MDFQKRMLPTSPDYIFQEEGYYVWGATMFRYQDSYYMIYSRWKQELGFLAWATDSQLCLAKTDSLHGKFKHVKVLFHYTDSETDEKICMHNPTVITWHGKIYLYYMINKWTFLFVNECQKIIKQCYLYCTCNNRIVIWSIT